MVDRSKYDIMESEEKTSSMAVVDLLVYIHSLIKKLENDEITSYECDEEIKTLISNACFNFKLIAHLGYENAKDLFRVDMKSISSSVRSDGITVSSFATNYEKVINRYAKTLLIFCVLDEEEIDVKDICDISTFNSLINGNTIELLEYFNHNDIILSNDNKELLTRFNEDNFVVSSLSSSQIKRLNDYHDSFVRRYIYPKITCDKDEKGRVLMQAKRISTAGRFNF